MRLKEKRFSIPFCAWDDDIDDKARLLLFFLFSRSDCSGKVSATYEDLMKGCGIASRNTMIKHLAALRAAGWFEYVRRKGWRPNTYFLCIPDRLQQHVARKNIQYIKFRAGKSKSGAA